MLKIEDLVFIDPSSVEQNYFGYIYLVTNKINNKKYIGQHREGLVFRDKEGKESFKAVSNTFLEKYHN